jgi:hypothetical protein
MYDKAFSYWGQVKWRELFLFFRQVIESELKAVNPDMKPIFFDALNRDGSISEQTISTESLGRAFGPLQKQVRFLHFVYQFS